MAAPNLVIEIINNDCSGLLFNDTTSDYGTGDVIGVGDVAEVKLNLTYNSTATTLKYVFTLSSGVITAATLAINSGTATNVLTEITNTTWPFDSDNKFELTGNYGVTIPTFADDVYTIEYILSGTWDGDAFEYSSSRSKFVGCASRCCIDKKWADIDPSCSCSNSARERLVYGESLFYVADLASEDGNLTRALNALNELKLFCSGDCGC